LAHNHDRLELAHHEPALDLIVDLSVADHKADALTKHQPSRTASTSPINDHQSFPKLPTKTLFVSSLFPEWKKSDET
jgi:hypothetical protein